MRRRKACRSLIREIRPSKVITIGQSMGAYAAVMYGLLLEVQQVIAFGPLSFLDPQQALLYHDRRWLSVMRDLAANPPASGYYDLQALGRAKAGALPDMHIIFGTKPDAAGKESVNLDAMHAGWLPSATAHCIPIPTQATLWSST
jgi:pimeloyl-ACP methyl ester carboxylesterase